MERVKEVAVRCCRTLSTDSPQPGQSRPTSRKCCSTKLRYRQPCPSDSGPDKARLFRRGPQRLDNEIQGIIANDLRLTCDGEGPLELTLTLSTTPSA